MADRIAEAGSPAGVVERLWEGRLGPGAVLLGPVLTLPELGFRGMVALRDLGYRSGLLPRHAAPAPTISVGNIRVGGTGKTPLVRWLVRTLRDRGRTPGILHGGYASDEPALHRLWFPDLPVVADRDRVRGARAAVEAGADVLVLDDAFQHRRIRRDLDLVLVAAEEWTDRPRLLPRGPYREPLRSLVRADLIVVTRRTAAPGAAAEVARRLRARTRRPTAVAHLSPGGWLAPDGTPRAAAPPPGGVAVAGVGRPGAFFQQVGEAGGSPDEVVAFRDHHAYSADDARRIAERSGAGPVLTTAKDAVKLAALLPERDLWILEQRVTFEEGRDRLGEQLEGAVE